METGGNPSVLGFGKGTGGGGGGFSVGGTRKGREERKLPREASMAIDARSIGLRLRPRLEAVSLNPNYRESRD